MRLFFILASVSVILSGHAFAKNNPLSLIEQTTQDGFAIYRSGQPDSKMAPDICKAGVRAVFSLNGSASKYAATLQKQCPDLHIVYNVDQDADKAVDHQFLEEFDQQVALAHAGGYGILFHCSCGCHRTGRLAAYYRLKYDHWTVKDAVAEMDKVGQHMSQHPSLPEQVQAYDDYLNGRKCSQAAQYCVK